MEGWNPNHWTKEAITDVSKSALILIYDLFFILLFWQKLETVSTVYIHRLMNLNVSLGENDFFSCKKREFPFHLNK